MVICYFRKLVVLNCLAELIVEDHLSRGHVCYKGAGVFLLMVCSSVVLAVKSALTLSCLVK